MCIELARDVASDGEGATRLLEVRVTGAPSAAIARDLARSIAASSLVKAAIFGADPNWGRILATVGARAGSQGFAIDPHRADGGDPGRDGVRRRAGARAIRRRCARRCGRPRCASTWRWRPARASATAWGCDLGYDYVKLNADYTSLIVQTADGQLAKDDRLTNYSPTFKRTLLVEALSYISRFAGTRCVVVFRGAAMTKPALAQAFCKDIELLRSCGLQPIVVHGHAPQNLVTLLNLDGGHAIGLSGNDGGLLRAKGGAITVSPGVVEVLLGQQYVPVISPVALGDDGAAHPLEPDAAAAALAVALGVPKLILLADTAGILEHGELVTELHAADLDRAQETGGIAPAAIRDALRRRRRPRARHRRPYAAQPDRGAVHRSRCRHAGDALMATATKTRRDEIRAIIASRPVATQEDLRELLAARGHAVTQATLSRDLAQLGARRAAQPGGGTAYELPLDGAPRTPLLRDLVRAVDDNGSLVVIHTTAGAAQVVASTFDRAHLPEALGTIAGDDTIFVAPARGVTTAKLARRLRDVLSV